MVVAAVVAAVVVGIGVGGGGNAMPAEWEVVVLMGHPQERCDVGVFGVGWDGHDAVVLRTDIKARDHHRELEMPTFSLFLI